MNDAPDNKPQRVVRPGDVLGLSAVLALFVGLGVLMATHNLLLAIEFAGAGFIVSIVVCATLLLTTSKPGGDSSDGPAGH